MDQKQMTQKDVQTLRYIQEHENQLNEFFKQMQLKKKDFQKTDTELKTDAQTPKPKLPNIQKNSRGQKVFSVEEMKKNYQNAWFGTKWLTLPYCRRTIFGKLQFWLGASFIFTYMWGSYYMRKNNITKLHWKYYRNTYGLFALATSTYVFVQSIFFEPYCNINSYHYNLDSNLSIARDIKKQLKDISK